MIPDRIEEALRLFGEANAFMRTAVMVEQREDELSHPLARAFRMVGRQKLIVAREAVMDGMECFTPALFDLRNELTPDLLRRDGERAARMFRMGRIFAEGMEEAARRRRAAAEIDALRAEVMAPRSIEVREVHPYDGRPLRAVPAGVAS